MSLSSNPDETSPQSSVPTNKSHKKHKTIPKLSTDIFPDSIIDEEPELASSLDISESNIDYTFTIKRFFSKGFLANSTITLFYQSPLIILLYYPYAFYYTGFIFGIVFLCLLLLNSYFTSFLILRIKRETSTHNYNEFIQKYLGENVCLVYRCIYFIYCFSLAMIYIYTYNQIINELLLVLSELERSLTIKILILAISVVLIGVPSLLCKNDKVNNVLQITNIALIVLCIVCICIYNVLNTDAYNIKELAYITKSTNISISLSIILS